MRLLIVYVFGNTLFDKCLVDNQNRPQMERILRKNFTAYYVLRQ